MAAGSNRNGVQPMQVDVLRKGDGKTRKAGKGKDGKGKGKDKGKLQHVKCNYCGKTGHKEENCWSKQRAEGKSLFSSGFGTFYHDMSFE